MSFIFDVSRAKPSRKLAKIMKSCAKANGCDFIEASIPGTGYQRWLSGSNKGEPFNSRLSITVGDAIDTAAKAAWLSAELEGLNFRRGVL